MSGFLVTCMTKINNVRNRMGRRHATEGDAVNMLFHAVHMESGLI